MINKDKRIRTNYIVYCVYAKYICLRDNAASFMFYADCFCITGGSSSERNGSVSPMSDWGSDSGRYILVSPPLGMYLPASLLIISD